MLVIKLILTPDCLFISILKMILGGFQKDPKRYSRACYIERVL